MKHTAHALATGLCLILITAHASAQGAANEPPKYGWQNSAVVGVNVTQVALENWTKGGENTLAFILFSKNAFNEIQEFYEWKNTIRLQYGQTKLGTREFEKSEDEIFLESVYSRKIGWAVDPYAALQVRTQFQPGYKLVKDANGVEQRVKTSDIWDPGYIQESFGFSYSSGPEFSTRLGIALKQTFSDKYGFARDPADPADDAKFRFQSGIESSSKFTADLMENMKLSSQLDLFSAFDKLDVWDVRWTTDITGKVNDFVNVSLNVMVVHEIAQTRKTQLKEALALGFSYALL